MSIPALFKSAFIRFFPLLALFIAAVSVIVQLKFGTMGDKGWLMHAAGEWLSGKKLYVDIFEVNPPLIVWLFAIPVWVSRHCYFLEDYAGLGLMGLCMVLLSIRQSLRVIVRHPGFESSPYRQAMFVLVLATSNIYLTSPVYFADREFIMLVMTFPYMLRFCPTLMHTAFPRGQSVVIGACAAIGFCIKPHAALIFMLLQVYYVMKSRTKTVLLSLENKVIYALTGVYVLTIAVAFRDYFTTVLPMALATYAQFNVRGSIHGYLPLAVTGLVIPFLDFRTRFATPFRPEVYYLLTIIALYTLYALLNNGWGYTYHPLFSMLFFLTAWLYWEYGWLKTEHEKLELETRPFQFGQRACAFCMGINWFYGLLSLEMLLLTFNCGGYSSCDDNTTFDNYIAANHVRSFGLMSAEFTRWPQISRESGAAWDTRFNHLWMLPALENEGKGPSPSQGWIVNYVGRAYAEDLTQRRPDIVFVDNSDAFYPSAYHIDIPQILKAAPEFAGAWAGYKFVASLDRCQSNTSDKDKVYYAKEGCRYDIYQRKDAPPPKAPLP